MKLMIVMALTLSACGIARAQSQVQTIAVQDAVLRLGMSQTDLATELAKDPYLFMNKEGAISNTSESNLADTMQSGRYRLFATVKFTGGRLTYVEKFWRLSDTPDTALVIMSALYGAVTSAVSNDGRSCWVHTWSSAQPDQDYKETSIECDTPGARRSIHAFVKTFHYTQDFHSVQVNEVLEKR